MKIRLLVLVSFPFLVCGIGRAAQVVKVTKTGKMALVSIDGSWPREKGAKYCVSHNRATGACGEVVKANKKAAVIRITSGWGKIQAGDAVAPMGGAAGRAPASEESLNEVISATSHPLRPREQKRLGFYVSLLGDPFPTLFGLNLAYNLFPFLRVTAGYGHISSGNPNDPILGSVSVTSIGGGIKGFVPNWQVSPMVGLNVANTSVTTTVPNTTLTAGGVSASGMLLYTTLGVDWQAKFGMDLSAGYNLVFSGGGGGLPFFNFGWFFNVF